MVSDRRVRRIEHRCRTALRRTRRQPGQRPRDDPLLLSAGGSGVATRLRRGAARQADRLDVAARASVVCAPPGDRMTGREIPGVLPASTVPPHERIAQAMREPPRGHEYANVARGHHLIELSALLRTNLAFDKFPSRISFEERDHSQYAVLSWQGRRPTSDTITVRASTPRDRLGTILHAHGPFNAPFAATESLDLPAASPGNPLMVYVDLLNDVGETAGGFHLHHREARLHLHELTLADVRRAGIHVISDDGRRTTVPDLHPAHLGNRNHRHHLQHRRMDRGGKGSPARRPPGHHRGHGLGHPGAWGP